MKSRVQSSLRNALRRSVSAEIPDSGFEHVSFSSSGWNFLVLQCLGAAYNGKDRKIPSPARTITPSTDCAALVIHTGKCHICAGAIEMLKCYMAWWCSVTYGETWPSSLASVKLHASLCKGVLYILGRGYNSASWYKGLKANPNKVLEPHEPNHIIMEQHLIYWFLNWAQPTMATDLRPSTQ